jgi:hypothetical protein
MAEGRNSSFEVRTVIARATLASWGVWSLLGGITLVLAGCGRYGSPYPPEKLSPKAVRYTTVKGTPQGVSFEWLAPDSDGRGRPLKVLLGYRIYRKELSKPSDLVNESVPYELVATVADQSIATLEAKREEAKQQQRPVRALKLTPESRRVSYLDTTPQYGKSYAYRVVPFNRESVEGDYREILKVVFVGEASQVTSTEATREDPSLVGDTEVEDKDTAEL